MDLPAGRQGSTIMKKEVLGIKIDDINIDQSLEKIAGWLLNSEKHYIVTPNPELVVMAQTDEGLKEIINNADLAIPDGVGLKLFSDIDCNTPGIDLMEQLIQLAAGKGYTTGFLGGKEGVANKTSECLKKKYPNLKVVFAESGGEVDKNGFVIASPAKPASPEHQRGEQSGLYTHSGQIAASPPLLAMTRSVDILFVAFGQPKQEKWIANNLDKIPVKVAMGVGGSFDYISGSVIRAPIFVRRIGCEWLYRLVIEPWRIKRQFALIKFILMLWQSKQAKRRNNKE